MEPVNTRNTEHYFWGDGAEGWHLLKQDNLSVIEERVPPGAEEKRHLHQKAQQFFYVLEGEASLEVDGIEHTLITGNGMHVPAQISHQLINKGTVDLRLLVISEPKSHGDRTFV